MNLLRVSVFFLLLFGLPSPKSNSPFVQTMNFRILSLLFLLVVISAIVEADRGYFSDVECKFSCKAHVSEGARVQVQCVQEKGHELSECLGNFCHYV